MTDQKNAADPAQVRAAQKKENNAEQLLRNAWHNIVQTTDGQLVLGAIRGFCREVDSPMTADNRTFYYVGRQDVSRFIENNLKRHNLNGYLEMIREEESA